MSVLNLTRTAFLFLDKGIYNASMLTFYKYHGAGNDFVVIDNRDLAFDKNDANLVRQICHRHFGIGADGILLLQNHPDYDFEMVYINSDGSYGSMCGNGGRCIVHFANMLGILKNPKQVRFLAADGPHEAEFLGDAVRLKMADVSEISEKNGLPFLYSGTTPHHIQQVVNLETFPVCDEARKVRDKNGEPAGVNVNYVEPKDGVFHVRTYERGVEDETLACGTGATSVAIYLANQKMLKENSATIKMPGGTLTITFEKQSDGTYKNIWLLGPVSFVCKGEWNGENTYLI